MKLIITLIYATVELKKYITFKLWGGLLKRDSFALQCQNRIRQQKFDTVSL